MPLNLIGPMLKISGLLTYTEARAALDAAANTLGFRVGLNHRAEDQVGVNTAKEIIEQLPAGTNTVLITYLRDVERIAELVGFVGAQAVLVHANIPAEGLPALRALSPETTILKAIHVTGEETIRLAQSYQLVADALMLDSRADEQLGATGQVHDWSISRRIVEMMHPQPIYLAGGLTSDNVAKAISAVRPDGVDANTGVEDPQGGKSRQRMASFIAAARTAFEGQLRLEVA